MKFMSLTAVATACVGGIASGASASVITGATYQVEQSGAFDVAFVSQSAGWTGSLYFLGHERDGIMHHAENSDQFELGRFMFDNHGTDPGFTLSLGEFDAGSTLHFGYLVFRGNKANGNIRYALRTDSSGDLQQFAIEDITPLDDSLRTTTLGIEDIVGQHSDWDYNDLQVNIIARAIPTPGSATLAGLALLVCCPRRRSTRNRLTIG
jgi:hypothetical protein